MRGPLWELKIERSLGQHPPAGDRSLSNSSAASEMNYASAVADKDERLMSSSDKRKQSLYFPEDMLKEIGDEAARQDRSLSWIVQKAWKTARKEIMKIPSVNEVPSESGDE